MRFICKCIKDYELILFLPLLPGFDLPLPATLISEHPFLYQHQEELDCPHKELLRENVLASQEAQCAQIPDLSSYTNKACSIHHKLKLYYHSLNTQKVSNNRKQTI